MKQYGGNMWEIFTLGRLCEEPPPQYKSCRKIHTNSIGKGVKEQNLSYTLIAIENLPSGQVVLTVNYDTGERYLSVEGLF